MGVFYMSEGDILEAAARSGGTWTRGGDGNPWLDENRKPLKEGWYWWGLEPHGPFETRREAKRDYDPTGSASVAVTLLQEFE